MIGSEGIGEYGVGVGGREDGKKYNCILFIYTV